MAEVAENYIRHNGENLWDFEIVSQWTYENVNRIHPLKQRDVGRLIEAVKKDMHIQAVIVFGSAVRFDCHSGSDLDVMIIRDDRKFAIDSPLDGIESEMDIIFSAHLGSRLEEEIAKTGVIVYRREENV